MDVAFCAPSVFIHASRATTLRATITTTKVLRQSTFSAFQPSRIASSAFTPPSLHINPSTTSVNSKTVISMKDHLMDLPLPDNTIQAEYVFIDGYNRLRSKARTLNKIPSKPEDLPLWNFDGSSTNQAPGNDSEVILKPRAIFKDPFRGGNNILVMCDNYTPAGEPLPSNSRYACAKVMEQAMHLEPWFGIEQEYFLTNLKTGRPLGFPEMGLPEPQAMYYCGVGADVVFGREIVEKHYRACIYAGIKISGINGEVAPGQWEFQVGPAVGMEGGDQIWMGRYLLERIAEIHGCGVDYSPKPVKGDWNGSGAHTNFSTKPMREEGGYKNAIIPAIEKLATKHKLHIMAYGAGNEERLTGKHETASIEKFSYGAADRGASCRIGHDTVKEGKGYFEDRRPAANMDPYVVTGLLVSTCCDIPME
uniref:Glutamine synthetase n=1 Tax=Dixoniella grisea TaxID=35153 RepID=F6L7F6_9RHOD|nr:glutamine synthetase II [Dixoniella grisea]